MEIHAPERHVRSLPDIVAHLATEARENIVSEVRDNKKELDRQIRLPTFPAHNRFEKLSQSEKAIESGPSARKAAPPKALAVTPEHQKEQ